MCLTGFLAELLCSAVESVEEYVQVVKEIEQSDIKQPEKVEDLSKVSNKNGESETEHPTTQTDKISVIAKQILCDAIQANPTVSAIKNTLGAVQDYRNGEEIPDIVKDRAVQMVEDQVPNVILQHEEVELKNGIQ